MPDLSVFDWIVRSQAVPQSCSPRSPTDGTLGNKHFINNNNVVPRVPPVPLANDDRWNEDDWRHAFDERAAILEYDGRVTRREADRRARLEIGAMRRKAEKS